MYTNPNTLPADIKRLEDRLSQQLPGLDAQALMAPQSRLSTLYDQNPESAKKSAVMVLLFYKHEKLQTAVIQRTIDDGPHSGQISFPGGKAEENDTDLIETAKRECFEEIGIEPTDFKIIGKLSHLYIPISNFLVQPVVAFLAEEPAFVLQHAEVDRVLVLPIEDLFHAQSKVVADIQVRDFRITTPVYQIGGCRIWGATAMMLSEFEVLIKDCKLVS